MIIQVPIGIASNLIRSRYIVNKYLVNGACKLYGTYCVLKSITTTGIVQNYRSQLTLLLNKLQLSRNSLESQIKQLQQLKLLQVTGSNIVLTSWENSCRIFDFEFEGLMHIEVPEKKLATKFIFYNLDIAENQDKQKSAIARKFNANPGLLIDIKNAMVQLDPKYSLDKLSKLTWTEFLKVLFHFQLQSYQTGTKALKLLHCYRANINRTAYNMACSWKMKGSRSVAYVKTKLSELGLASIVKIEPVSSPALVRARSINKNYADNFDKSTKLPVWHVSDQINLNFLPMVK